MPASPGEANAHAPSATADAASARTPDAQTLIAQARSRLARELDGLPPWKSPLLRARLLAAPTPGATPEEGVSYGALVHFIRHAVAQDEPALAHELFAALLQRTDRAIRRWAARTVASGVRDAYDELRQELALRLWEHIGRGRHDAWELFFQRALTFEQRRLGARFLERMRRQPLPMMTGTGGPSDAHAVHLAHTWRALDLALQHTPAMTIADLADQQNAFAAADLADLRSYVALLPNRERQATLLRFWCGASEEEIARALGGVTTRTVRNLLTRAYARLRRLYLPDASPAEPQPQRRQQPQQPQQTHRKGSHHASPTG